jgi:hypothetical protein
MRLGEHTLPLAITALTLALLMALIIRSLPALFESRGRLLALLAAMLPLAEALLFVLGIVLGLERAKRLPAAAFVGAIVLAVHALALLWWPSLYGVDETIVRHGAAWCMWSVACLVAAAWYAAESGR